MKREKRLTTSRLIRIPDQLDEDILAASLKLGLPASEVTRRSLKIGLPILAKVNLPGAPTPRRESETI
jgi:hypothetical protein